MKLLFVDDDHRLRESLADYFRWVEGWEVIGAATPRAAWAEVQKPGARFDVILLDIMMPPDGPIPPEKSGNGLDTGLVLLDLLTEMGHRVVILSARQDLHFTVADGRASAYLRKTQTPEEIVEAIQSVIEARRSAEESKP